jgi:3-oxoacyl-[acyl-carrier protein] reductase
LDSTKEDWIRAFEANFFGTVICSREAAKIMLEKEGGKIINTASVRGHSGTGREAIMGYSAAKAAVINFTRTLAKQLAPRITVNAVSPGFVTTPPIVGMSDEQKAAFVDATPIGRLIKPEEMAEAFLFLAESDVVTGTVMLVDGGFTLKIA